MAAGGQVFTLTAPARRGVLVRRVRFLVGATIAYNVIEAVVAITAGTVASSGALVAFGLDSVIEVASAGAVAWQFSATGQEAVQLREKTTLRIIAVSFFALAAYVSVDSLRALTGTAEAGHSTVGLVPAMVSLAVMPGLSYAQRRAGRELGSASAVADPKQRRGDRPGVGKPAVPCRSVPRGPTGVARPILAGTVSGDRAEDAGSGAGGLRRRDAHGARLRRHRGAVAASGAGTHPVPAVAMGAHPQPPGDARPGHGRRRPPGGRRPARTDHRPAAPV